MGRHFTADQLDYINSPDFTFEGYQQTFPDDERTFGALDRARRRYARPANYRQKWVSVGTPTTTTTSVWGQRIERTLQQKGADTDDGWVTQSTLLHALGKGVNAESLPALLAELHECGSIEYRLRPTKTKPAEEWRLAPNASLQDVGLISVKAPLTDADIDRAIDLMVERYDQRLRESPTQEFTEWLPPGNIPVGVVFTGDWHVGGGGCDIGKLRDDLIRIGATDGLYAIGMGDYVEGVGPKNKAAPALLEGEENDGDRQERIALRLAMHVDGRWLAVMAGNHDEWMRASSGVSRTSRVFGPLRCPLFHQGGGTVFANVGSERYVIAVSHRGVGKGGNSVLNTTNAQRRTFDAWPQWENCDVICLGHFHYNDLAIPPRKGRSTVYLRSGTYKTWDSYAFDAGYTPECGTPMVILYPDRRKIRAFRGDEFEDGVETLIRERAKYVEQAT